MTSAAFVLCALAASATLTASREDWPWPKVVNVFSDDGSHFVRIIPVLPGDPAIAGRPRRARGEFYVRQRDRNYHLVADVPLENPDAPVDVMLSNSGFLLTFDNWHRIGYGKVIVVYDPQGRLIRAHEVEQLYGALRASVIPLSTSSRWWRCRPHGFVDREQSQVYVFEYFGGTFVIDLRTGGTTYNEGKNHCEPPIGPLSTSWFSP